MGVVINGQVTIAEVIDGEPGKDGKPGVDGKDGIDGITVPNVIRKVRYIRDWLNGTVTGSSYSFWNEIKAMSGSVNRAKNAYITSNISISNIGSIVDGSVTNIGAYGNTNTDKSYVIVDLGQVYEDIDYIRIWHYFGGADTYRDTKTEVSTDGVTWETLFDSALTGTYQETEKGNTLLVNGSAVSAVADQVNNAVVTVNEQGITVLDGNFGLESSKGGLWYVYDTDIDDLQEVKPFRNYVQTLENLVLDHSFEMLERDLYMRDDGYWDIPSIGEYEGRWGTIGTPRIASEYKGYGSEIKEIPFGQQMVITSFDNFVRQQVKIEANRTYTLSFHVSTTGLYTPGTAEVYFKYLGDGKVVQESTYVRFDVPDTDYNESTRYAITFTTPHTLSYSERKYVEFGFRTVASNTWLAYDGIQLVDSPFPVTYIPDSEAWRIRRGGMDKYPVLDTAGSIVKGQLVAQSLTMDGYVSNGYNLGTIRDGTTYHTDPMLIQNVLVTVSVNESYSGYVDVTFPVPFTVTPLWIMTTPTNSNSSAYNTSVQNYSPTGCRVYISHINKEYLSLSTQVQVVACGRRS